MISRTCEFPKKAIVQQRHHIQVFKAVNKFYLLKHLQTTKNKNETF